MAAGAIYLDYAATTPTDPVVARAMSEVLQGAAQYGNASSITHEFGRRAQARVSEARAQVAALIGSPPDDVVFTSGATESNNLALLGVARANADRGKHIVTSRIEHKAVLDPCKQLEREGFAVSYVVPDSSGRVSADVVRAALRPGTVLVSIMHANNEIGVVQDIYAIGAVCRERGVVFHTDAAQSIGKVAVDVVALGVDLLSFTAHKIYGPQGVGALYVAPRVRAMLRPVTFGGGQERGLRPGTLPLHQIVGFGVAAELAACALPSEAVRIAALRDRLWSLLACLDGVHLNGEGAPQLPGILNVSFEGVEGESLVTALREVAVTTGSACSSASGEPSYVLRALGRNTQLAQSSLRFSLGRFTTEAEVDAAAAAVGREVRRLRALSPASGLSGTGFSASHVQPAASASSPPAARLLTEEALPQAQLRGGTLPTNSLTEEALPGAMLASRPTDAVHDTLSPKARHYFDSLAGAGTFGVSGPSEPSRSHPSPSHSPLGDADRVIQGEAGSLEAGTWIRFHLRVALQGQGGRASEPVVKAALFQAYACPHTLAVTAWLTEQLPGRPRTDLVPGTPAAWLDTMEVPVEKLGRLLTVEDALRSALQTWAASP